MARPLDLTGSSIWDAGLTAAENGLSEIECPYSDHISRAQWLSGFNRGQGMLEAPDGSIDDDVCAFVYGDESHA